MSNLWYKNPQKLTLISVLIAIIFGIPAYIIIFKPQKVIVVKPLIERNEEKYFTNHEKETKTPPHEEESVIPPKTELLKKLTPLETETKTPPHEEESVIPPKTELLRKLTPLETGKHPSELTNNIYGFTHAGYIPLQHRYPKSKIIELSSTRIVKGDFEIQKINNKCYLVGFIGNETFAKIGVINKLKNLELTVFPYPFKTFKNLISIPLDSITEIKERRLDFDKHGLITVLDITTNKVLTNVQSHTTNNH